MAMDEYECDQKVHVAVGKSLKKGTTLIRWCFTHFSKAQICLLHVYQPSTMIPTLLGKLPASQASPEVVSAYRIEEREETKRLLEKYSSLCRAAKVKVSSVIGEADQVQTGIVDLVTVHNIRKLVIGAITPENCMKIKRNSSKANFAAKNAPPFCEIWFVYKGKHIWTREASETHCFVSSHAQPETTTAESLSCRSLQYGTTELLHSECLQSNSARATRSTVPNVIIEAEATFSSKSSSCSSHCSPQHSEFEEETIDIHLIEAKAEANAATDVELLKCRRLEFKAIEAISKVNLFESAHAHEVKLRKEVEDAVRATIKEQRMFLEEKEKIASELERTTGSISLLGNCAHEINSKCDEAANELSLIQASFSSLQHEKQEIRRQKMEALHWLERWKSCGHVGADHCDGIIGFSEEFPELAEFPLSDLQNATCNFSESFKAMEGGYGSIYKGEMLGRTVAIRKLHSHNMQGSIEFQQEVRILGSLQHPNLVTLLGVCPEAWSFVYDFYPNGTLQDYLFRKGSLLPLTWSIRARWVFEIARALCFLHSSRPETIVHGGLTLETVLLDTALGCKICEFGFSRLVKEESLSLPSFHLSTEPKGPFSYTDPELQRTGVLTPKSDVYSFGLIILQLLTSRTPVGLAGEVRRAVSCGKLSSILDSSAGEWNSTVATQLAELGLQCCQLNSRDRPELTPSLVRELKQLYVSEERPVPSFFLCPISQEIMNDPQVAADGFTYERKAISEWLDNGHETSPMTNLKLSYLHLTPNHALRLAIQGWLCKS
ncbi:U-box domain-containing protein 33-like isoform X1 [Vigna umbellata]|uniref:U-box domain-containing protein 33-like isoform X1 n=2 Tax=Vigna umbellata TaxID=87088 RepID=UPI001F5F2102|nr:U-box domain-containing protein 33-like isoform X1 [Vigna umbellata]